MLGISSVPRRLHAVRLNAAKFFPRREGACARRGRVGFVCKLGREPFSLLCFSFKVRSLAVESVSARDCSRAPLARPHMAGRWQLSWYVGAGDAAAKNTSAERSVPSDEQS